MKLDEIKDLISKYDWQGLAEAYHKSQMSLAKEEWLELFSWIRSQEVERVKGLIVQEINQAHSDGQPTSRLTSLANKIDEI